MSARYKGKTYSDRKITKHNIQYKRKSTIRKPSIIHYAQANFILRTIKHLHPLRLWLIEKIHCIRWFLSKIQQHVNNSLCLRALYLICWGHYKSWMSNLILEVVNMTLFNERCIQWLKKETWYVHGTTKHKYAADCPLQRICCKHAHTWR